MIENTSTNIKKMEKKKIIKCVVGPDGNLGVEAISLVEFPAIESNWVALKKAVKLEALDNERRMLYGPALIPDKPILRVDKETGEDYYIVFDKETIYPIFQLVINAQVYIGFLVDIVWFLSIKSARSY